MKELQWQSKEIIGKLRKSKETKGNRKKPEEKKGNHWGKVLASESIKIAVNKEIVVNDELLSDGCEVAFLPPVTGG